MTDQEPQPQANDTIYRRMGQQDILPNSIKYQHLDTGIMGADGWMDVQELWRYSSASGNAYTLTVPSDATLKYSIGDRVKLTQDNITTSYFYITAVTSSSLTLNGGSAYSITNKSINEAHYSKISSPLGFPNWFNWNPTLSFDGTPPSGTLTATYRFMMIGTTVFYRLKYAYSVAGATNTRCNVNYVPVATTQGTTNEFNQAGTGSTTVVALTSLPSSTYNKVFVVSTGSTAYIQLGVITSVAMIAGVGSGFYEI